ncbi:AarF/ABC1/UbiB kinase family protein [Spirulina sp. CCNP1310]|uniref:ABC1 kinase family protein n=1 Tax=Spirulina sp. CCNP1310 TaxID=3110249 RepID=UPI002B213F37|nr:AarF/ABC1/UbiB kinase family protein [Spirulina sp. CCNP1310]MEA5419968.1 AarF/ABC1/UbiB kinase family protein [Spirulina sp. CCNP1310]
MKAPRWQRKKYSPLTRQLDIFGVATQFFIQLGGDRLWGNGKRQRRRRAQWLVRQLLELGPTFIKLGQALSTRSDLIPLEYVEALSELQDRVPPFGTAEAMAVIEAELGGSVQNLFEEFDPFPLAAASLGQVHRAKLYSGEEVVVKVQRPGLEALFNLDIEVLHRVVRLLNQYVPGARKYELEALYHEFFGLLYQEIDYMNEGRNAERFQNNFKNYHHILVPKVYWRYTSKKVLTLEYLPGIKIDDRRTIEDCQIDPNHVIQLGVSCYLKQLLEDGFFQSDPHPGNMAVRRDGRLIFYDFGTMTEVKALAKDQMINTFFGVLRKDTNAVVDSLMYMGLLEPMQDMTPVRRVVSFVLDRFREKPVDLRAFQEMSDEVYVLFEQQPFRLPAQMMFIVKSVSTLDGIARNLNPQYNLLAASKPFIANLTQNVDKGNLLRKLAKQARSFVQYQLTKPSSAEQAIALLESRINQGEWEFRTRSDVSDRLLRRIHLALKCLIYTCLTGFTFLGGIGLLLGGHDGGAIALFGLAAFWFFLLARNLISLWAKERLEKLL